MGFFRYEGHNLAYTIHGRGPRTTVLMPGLLASQKMQAPLAADLAGYGNRVFTFDFLGHGASDRPEEMGHYSMPEFARQAVALLDHLKLEQAVVGGTSLGANVTLEVAALTVGSCQHSSTKAAIFWVRRSGLTRSSMIELASIRRPLGNSAASMSASENGWSGSRG